MPEFEWDEAKRQANIAKHGIDFLRIQQMFDGRPLWVVDTERHGEPRTISIGLLHDHVYTVVTTRRSSRIGSSPHGGQVTMSEPNIVRYTVEELDEMIRRGEDQTDWERVRNMTDEEIEANIDREDEGYFDLSTGYRSSGIPVPRQPGGPLVEPDVLAWFREHHPGDYEAKINTVLREFVAGQDERQAS